MHRISLTVLTSVGVFLVAVATFIFTTRDHIGRLITKVRGAIGPFYRTNLKINALDEKLDRIEHLLKPNGGTSIPDSLKRIETAQSQATVRVFSLLDSSSMAMWEADATGSRVWANRAYLAIVGRSLADTLGYGWINAIHHDDRAAVRDQWTRAVNEQRNFEEVYRLTDLAGKTTKVSVIARPSFVDGKLISFIAEVHPVS